MTPKTDFDQSVIDTMIALSMKFASKQNKTESKCYNFFIKL